MSQENLTRLQAGLQAFAQSGETDVEFLDPDFELRQASSIVDTAGVFRGRDALSDSLRELRESFEELRFDPEKFIEAPGGDIVVLVRAQGRGRGSRVEIDNHIAWVWTFRDGKAVRLTVYEEQAEALNAAGLDRATPS